MGGDSDLCIRVSTTCRLTDDEPKQILPVVLDESTPSNICRTQSAAVKSDGFNVRWKLIYGKCIKNKRDIEALSISDVV